MDRRVSAAAPSGCWSSAREPWRQAQWTTELKINTSWRLVSLFQSWLLSLVTSRFSCLFQKQRPVDDDQQEAQKAGSVDNRVEDQHVVVIGKQQLAIGCKDVSYSKVVDSIKVWAFLPKNPTYLVRHSQAQKCLQVNPKPLHYAMKFPIYRFFYWLTNAFRQVKFNSH